jgi:hypothetical protein
MRTIERRLAALEQQLPKHCRICGQRDFSAMSNEELIAFITAAIADLAEAKEKRGGSTS